MVGSRQDRSAADLATADMAAGHRVRMATVAVVEGTEEVMGRVAAAEVAVEGSAPRRHHAVIGAVGSGPQADMMVRAAMVMAEAMATVAMDTAAEVDDHTRSLIDKPLSAPIRTDDDRRRCDLQGRRSPIAQLDLPALLVSIG